MSELSREQVERLKEAALHGSYGDAVVAAEVYDSIAPTVDAMLAEGDQLARAEVVRDVRATLLDLRRKGEIEWTPAARVSSALARHMPSSVREGGTERSGDVQRPDGPRESAGPSDGRTGPRHRQRCRCGKDAGHTDAPRDGRLCGEQDPTCGEALGDMRCQLRRGRDGGHEDWRGVAQERRG